MNYYKFKATNNILYKHQLQAETDRTKQQKTCKEYEELRRKIQGLPRSNVANQMTKERNTSIEVEQEKGK